MFVLFFVIALMFTIVSLMKAWQIALLKKYNLERREAYSAAKERYDKKIGSGEYIAEPRMPEYIRIKESDSILSRIYYYTLPLTIIFLFVALTIQIVGSQEIGVKVTPAGVSEEELYTGWHIVAPWHKVYRLDKTVQVYSFTSAVDEGQKVSVDAIWCPTSVGIKMGFDFSMTWKILESEASWVFANLQDKGSSEQYDWIEENIIRPVAKSILPLTVSKYTPIEVYSTKRQEIQDEVYHTTKEILMREFKIVLVKIDIREVYYNQKFEEAITNKTLAEQEAERLVDVTRQKEELLKQEKIQKDITITAAQAESEALKIKGQSITANPKIIDLEWIQRWNGILPQYIMGSGSASILLQPSLTKRE